MKIQTALSLPSLGRTCLHVFDFGDDATIGKQLKTREKKPELFGVFMGKNGDKYAVAVYEGCSWNLGSVEEFSSESEMKEKWQLD